MNSATFNIWSVIEHVRSKVIDRDIQLSLDMTTMAIPLTSLLGKQSKPVMINNNSV